MDRGAWWGTVHGVAKSQRRMSDFTFFLQCMKVKSEREVAQSCPTLRDPIHELQPTRLHRPWDFPGKSTGVGCRRLLLLGTPYK